MYPSVHKNRRPRSAPVIRGSLPLGIIEYHEVVESGVLEAKEAKVPVVRVKLVQSLRLSLHQISIVQVHVEDCGAGSPVYMEGDPHLEDETGLCVEDALLQLDASGCAQMVVSNPSSYTQVWNVAPPLAR